MASNFGNEHCRKQRCELQTQDNLFSDGLMTIPGLETGVKVKSINCWKCIRHLLNIVQYTDWDAEIIQNIV